MKILVAGDVQGNLDKLFSRVEQVNAKSGPFDLLLCVGQFLVGTKTIPTAFDLVIIYNRLVTYFLQNAYNSICMLSHAYGYTSN